MVKTRRSRQDSHPIRYPHASNDDVIEREVDLVLEGYLKNPRFVEARVTALRYHVGRRAGDAQASS